MRKNSDVTFKIDRIYGFLNPEKTKVYLRVSWNGGDMHDEVRRCKLNDSGDIERLGKGIALEDRETMELAALHKRLVHREPVNFARELAIGEEALRRRGL